MNHHESRNYIKASLFFTLLDSRPALSIMHLTGAITEGATEAKKLGRSVHPSLLRKAIKAGCVVHD